MILIDELKIGSLFGEMNSLPIEDLVGKIFLANPQYKKELSGL